MVTFLYNYFILNECTFSVAMTKLFFMNQYYREAKNSVLKILFMLRHILDNLLNMSVINKTLF